MPSDTDSIEAKKEASRKLELFRQMVRHENDLINHRMGWLLQFEGFLFAAASMVLEKSSFIVPPLALLGIAAALSSWLALRGARAGIEKMAKKAEDLEKEHPGEPGVRAYMLGESWHGKVREFLLPWSALPLALSIVWVWLLCIVRCR